MNRLTKEQQMSVGAFQRLSSMPYCCFNHSPAVRLEVGANGLFCPLCETVIIHVDLIAPEILSGARVTKIREGRDELSKLLTVWSRSRSFPSRKEGLFQNGHS